MMGKNKTQRTEALMQAARRYALAKCKYCGKPLDNSSRLCCYKCSVKRNELGLGCVECPGYEKRQLNSTEPTGNPEIYDYDPEYKFKGGASRKALPPEGAGSALIIV